MALRRRNDNGLDAWPGYVDALSTLLMVTIFVLLVFVLAEAFLSSALTGSDNTISQLKDQIAQLSSALDLEKSNSASLSQELAALNAQLAQAKAANIAMAAQLATANGSVTALTTAEAGLQEQLSDAQAQSQSSSARIAALQSQLATQGGGSLQDQLTQTQSKLAAQTQISETALNEVDLLNQQLAALRLQMAMLAQALDAAQAADAKDHVQIVDLGKQLNEALARKVEELQSYRSEFFGTLRAILANEPNIKIVGDRFVFESDVLFPVDQATHDAGRPGGNRRCRRRHQENRRENSTEHQLGAFGRWLCRRAADHRRPIPFQFRPLRRAFVDRGQSADQERRAGRADRRDREWRRQPDRRRQKQGRLRAEPPHRIPPDQPVGEKRS